jgi:hypothetical protein
MLPARDETVDAIDCKLLAGFESEVVVGELMMLPLRAHFFSTW